MKLVRRSLHELGRAFRVFAPYRGVRKVSVFGSARTSGDDPEYAIAPRLLARDRRAWLDGDHRRRSGHHGRRARRRRREQSFGVGIKLPMEQGANGFIAGDPKLIDFKYFFTRKITFMKESDAFVLLPGGFGTMDEGFELLTLMQTGKTAIRPVVLLEPEGGDYWEQWMRFVKAQLVDSGLASPEDLSLFERANSIDGRRHDHRALLRQLRLSPLRRRAPGAAVAPPSDGGAVGGAERQLRRPRRRGPHRGDHHHPRRGARRRRRRSRPHRLPPRHNFGRIRQLIDALNAM